MSAFEVPIVKVTKVEDHPNADRLSLVYFRGFTTISAKLEDGSHRYKEDDLVVYVPEGAVVPEYLLRQGFWDDVKGKGILAGTKGDRVKAIKLRGIVSQGIMFPVRYNTVGDPGQAWIEVPNTDAEGFWRALYVNEGDDVAEDLGVTKYEPPIPVAMAGEITNIGAENTINFDVENYQKYPHVMNDPEEIVHVTEKLHGTFCQIAYIPGMEHPDGFFGGSVFVGSKGLSAQGLMFKNNEINKSNLYIRAVIDTEIAQRFSLAMNLRHLGSRAYLLGEVYGTGVQDLGYGAASPAFRAFAVRIGSPRGEDGQWLGADELMELTDMAGIERVPTLAYGRWGRILEELEKFRDGKTALGGNHIREGVVITPVKERYHPEIGRVCLKVISPDYLTRKGNVTEFN